MTVKFEPVVLGEDGKPTGPNIDGNEALGADTYKWASPDGSLALTFGRVRGLASLRIARILGPTQSNNPTLEIYYKAVAGIRTWNGEPFSEPMTEMQYEGVMSQFGTIDTVDENLTRYVNAWQLTLFPELAQAMQEAGLMGMSPESKALIAQNAGKATAKKSPRAGRSRRS